MATSKSLLAVGLIVGTVLNNVLADPFLASFSDQPLDDAAFSEDLPELSDKVFLRKNPDSFGEFLKNDKSSPKDLTFTETPATTTENIVIDVYQQSMNYPIGLDEAEEFVTDIKPAINQIQKHLAILINVTDKDDEVTIPEEYQNNYVTQSSDSVEGFTDTVFDEMASVMAKVASTEDRLNESISMLQDMDYSYNSKIRNFLLQRYILVREAISEQLEALDFCRKVVELLNLSPMEGITYDYETSGSSGDQVNDEISMEEAQDFATDTDEFIENVQDSDDIVSIATRYEDVQIILQRVNYTIDLLYSLIRNYPMDADVRYGKVEKYESIRSTLHAQEQQLNAMLNDLESASADGSSNQMGRIVDPIREGIEAPTEDPNEANDGNWEKEDYDPDYSEDYDYDSEITLKAVERSVDNITAKTTYIDKLLNWLDEAIYNNQTYTVFPFPYQINGRTEISIEDLEDEIDDKIEDTFDELDQIEELVEEKIMYLNSSGSSYDYVTEGSGMFMRYRLIEKYSNVRSTLLVDTYGALENLMTKLQKLRSLDKGVTDEKSTTKSLEINSSSMGTDSTIPYTDVSNQFGIEAPTEDPNEANDGNWEKEDYGPDYSEDYDYDSEITLKAVERSVDNITAKTTYIDKLLNWLDEAIYNNQAYVIIPVQYQIDGRTEMSIEDLEDDIEDKIEDAFDELDHIVVLVEDKIIYLNFSGSSYDYVVEGSGSYERYRLIEKYSNVQSTLLVDKTEALENLMTKLQKLRSLDKGVTEEKSTRKSLVKNLGSVGADSSILPYMPNQFGKLPDLMSSRQKINDEDKDQDSNGSDDNSLMGILLNQNTRSRLLGKAVNNTVTFPTTYRESMSSYNQEQSHGMNNYLEKSTTPEKKIWNNLYSSSSVENMSLLKQLEFFYDLSSSYSSESSTESLTVQSLPNKKSETSLPYNKNSDDLSSSLFPSELDLTDIDDQPDNLPSYGPFKFTDSGRKFLESLAPELTKYISSEGIPENYDYNTESPYGFSAEPIPEFNDGYFDSLFGDSTNLKAHDDVVTDLATSAMKPSSEDDEMNKSIHLTMIVLAATLAAVMITTVISIAICRRSQRVLIASKVPYREMQNDEESGAHDDLPQQLAKNVYAIDV